MMIFVLSFCIFFQFEYRICFTGLSYLLHSAHMPALLQDLQDESLGEQRKMSTARLDVFRWSTTADSCRPLHLKQKNWKFGLLQNSDLGEIITRVIQKPREGKKKKNTKSKMGKKF